LTIARAHLNQSDLTDCSRRDEDSQRQNEPLSVAMLNPVPVLDQPASTQPNQLTFNGRIRSIRFAVRGVRIMLATQQNAWIHAAATVVVVTAGALFELTWAEWCWIVLAIVSVWTAEALNTAFEFLTDVASPNFHPIAANAKDVAAGAVLLTAIGAVIIGALVFGPKISTRSNHAPKETVESLSTSDTMSGTADR
jgi:diacylglycerol kinase (ATP)